MGLRIGSSFSLLGLGNRLGRVSDALNDNYLRLATGKAYLGAADGAARVSMAARLKSRIASADAAASGLQDGLSVVEAADAGLAEIEGSLERMRELAVEASSGTLTSEEKDALQAEFAQLVATVDAVANGTEFNGTALLNGDTATLDILATPDGGTQALTLTDNNADALSGDLGALDISSDAAAALTSVDAALAQLGTHRAEMGGHAVRFRSSHEALVAQSEAMSGALSRIADVDVARETALLTKNAILQQAGIAVMAQANFQAQSMLALLHFP